VSETTAAHLPPLSLIPATNSKAGVVDNGSHIFTESLLIAVTLAVNLPSVSTITFFHLHPKLRISSRIFETIRG
jgi:hypothetical protein